MTMRRVVCGTLAVAFLTAVGCAKTDDAGREARRARAGLMPSAPEPAYDAQYLADQSQVKTLPARTITREPLETYRANNRAKLEEAAARSADETAAHSDAAAESVEEADRADESTEEKNAFSAKKQEKKSAAESVKSKPEKQDQPVETPAATPPSGQSTGMEKKDEPAAESGDTAGAEQSEEGASGEVAEGDSAEGRDEEGREEEGRDERGEEGREENNEGGDQNSEKP